jgi:hypothetical protein
VVNQIIRNTLVAIKDGSVPLPKGCSPLTFIDYRLREANDVHAGGDGEHCAWISFLFYSRMLTRAGLCWIPVLFGGILWIPCPCTEQPRLLHPLSQRRRGEAEAGGRDPDRALQR